jgi:hypothetical protein
LGLQVQAVRVLLEFKAHKKWARITETKKGQLTSKEEIHLQLWQAIQTSL